MADINTKQNAQKDKVAAAAQAAVTAANKAVNTATNNLQPQRNEGYVTQQGMWITPEQAQSTPTKIDNQLDKNINWQNELSNVAIDQNFSPEYVTSAIQSDRDANSNRMQFDPKTGNAYDSIGFNIMDTEDPSRRNTNNAYSQYFAQQAQQNEGQPTHKRIATMTGWYEDLNDDGFISGDEMADNGNPNYYNYSSPFITAEQARNYVDAGFGTQETLDWLERQGYLDDDILSKNDLAEHGYTMWTDFDGAYPQQAVMKANEMAEGFWNDVVSPLRQNLVQWDVNIGNKTYKGQDFDNAVLTSIRTGDYDLTLVDNEGNDILSNLGPDGITYSFTGNPNEINLNLGKGRNVLLDLNGLVGNNASDEEIVNYVNDNFYNLIREQSEDVHLSPVYRVNVGGDTLSIPYRDLPTYTNNPSILAAVQDNDEYIYNSRPSLEEVQDGSSVNYGPLSTPNYVYGDSIIDNLVHPSKWKNLPSQVTDMALQSAAFMNPFSGATLPQRMFVSGPYMAAYGVNSLQSRDGRYEPVGDANIATAATPLAGYLERALGGAVGGELGEGVFEKAAHSAANAISNRRFGKGIDEVLTADKHPILTNVAPYLSGINAEGLEEAVTDPIYSLAADAGNAYRPTVENEYGSTREFAPESEDIKDVLMSRAWEYLKSVPDSYAAGAILGGVAPHSVIPTVRQTVGDYKDYRDAKLYPKFQEPDDSIESIRQLYANINDR